MSNRCPACKTPGDYHSSDTETPDRSLYVCLRPASQCRVSLFFGPPDESWRGV